MPRARPFLFPECQAGVFHVVSRCYDRKTLLDEEAKAFLLKVLRSYEELLGVELLTFSVMDNHFHLLIRVPHRPAGFDLPLAAVVERLMQSVGQEAAALLRRDLDFWEKTDNTAAIEEWRQKQIARMFSLSEFVKCVKQRFSRWYNKRNDRKGTVWEDRFLAVIVAEEERALRTMAAYIDLNAVRAGIVQDPADYRWCAYAEAMAGETRARRGLVRIVGQCAWLRADAAAAEPWGSQPFSPMIEKRALVFYRALLGAQGQARRRQDGSIARRGLPEPVRQRFLSASEQRLASEVLHRRVRNFTRGLLFGSRAFVDQWFERHRDYVAGSSRVARKRGSIPLGNALLRGLYTFRNSQT
jgi:REP element-mobilizing transposase RayT